MGPISSSFRETPNYTESMLRTAALLSTTEKVGAFTIGFIVEKNFWFGGKNTLRLAGYSVIAYSALNAVKCVTEGSSTFITSSLTDGLLGMTGFISGNIYTMLNGCKK